MKTEIHSLLRLKTFKEVKKERAKNIIGSRFVYAVKRTGKLKARLVAQGFMQKESIFKDSNSSPTANPVTFRILLKLVACSNLKMFSIEFDSAYLIVYCPSLDMITPLTNERTQRKYCNCTRLLLDCKIQEDLVFEERTDKTRPFLF